MYGASLLSVYRKVGESLCHTEAQLSADSSGICTQDFQHVNASGRPSPIELNNSIKEILSEFDDRGFY